MEEHPLQDEPISSVCANCGIRITPVEGRAQICDNCRHQFINYPIPKWIKGFGLGLLLVLLFSLFTVSKNIATGIHFKRGKASAEKANYLTAEREFQLVAKKEPAYIEGQCNLLLAAYHNHDFSTVLSVVSQIANQKLEDNSLYNEVNNAIDGTSSYFPSDSLLPYLAKYNMSTDSMPESLFQNYIAKNEKDQFAQNAYARWLFDKEKYFAADSLLNRVLAADADQYSALSLKAPLKREMGQMDSSFYYADKMLALNHEDVFAMSCKVRTLLKQKRDDEALQLAKKTYSLDNRDTYTLATLAMAYHFNKNIAERDAILAKAAEDTSSASTVSYVKNVIAGKEKFRN